MSNERRELNFDTTPKALIEGGYTAGELMTGMEELKDHQERAEQENLEKRISNVLNLIGVPARTKGWHYTVSAIEMLYHNPTLIDSVTKGLYPAVAEQNRATAKATESCIRHTIEVAWNRRNPEVVKKFFGRTVAYRRRKPTNMDFLIMIVNYLHMEALETIVKKDSQESDKKVNLKERISEVLNLIGVPAHIQGRRYTVSAIEMLYHDPTLIDSVTKGLYPTVAEKNGTTVNGVEKGIGIAIERAWDRGEPEVMEEFFGYTIDPQKGKPTNREFLSMIVNHLHMEALETVKQQESQESDKKVNLEERISEVLNLIGVPAHIKGRRYTVSAIEMLYYNPTMIDAINRELYPAVAEKNRVTAKATESGIRHTIEVAWNRRDPEMVKKFFGHTVAYRRVKPTNIGFLIMIVNYLHREDKKKGK